MLNHEATFFIISWPLSLIRRTKPFVALSLN
jgi:hypothetical protein